MPVRSGSLMTRPRVGIVGAGQLGRMLALSGYPLGIDCTLLDTSADSPGAQVAASVLGALDDPRALAKLADRVVATLAGAALVLLCDVAAMPMLRAREVAK